jgi:hypothetical protein
MAFPDQLASLALTPLLDRAFEALGPVGAERAVEAVAGFLSRQFLDHSQRLPAALARANRDAWKALEIALAGESLWTWLDRAEHKAFREHIRAFLDAGPLAGLPADSKELRQQCLRELRVARKAGFMELSSLDPGELARAAGSFARFADPQRLLDAEWQAIRCMADVCEAAGYTGLAQLIVLPTSASGMPLLVSAVRFFFRREIESDPELFQGLAWAKLETLEALQDQRFAGLAEALAEHAAQLESTLEALHGVVVETHGVVLDIQDEVLGLARKFALLHRELRPRDSLSIGSEAERLLVKQVIGRYRALPEEERRRLPALLNAVGKLEVAAGAFGAAQKDFEEAARLSADQQARAEAHYNAFGAALEQAEWPAALASLKEAAALDPARFAPFPLAKYEPERILGAGGFGVAFLCRNRFAGGRVVVKALRPDTLERAMSEVFGEAQILEELEHPAIIRLRDCDYADAGQTRPYLVMDYFEGQTLAEHVAQHGPLAAEDLLALVGPVAEALQAAHARGILHRDVKPANLLVRREPAAGAWRVKLIDFGLALRQDVLRATIVSTPQRTLTGNSIAGTLEYAAPEQMGRLPGIAVGPYSDVYGFGKTCCFALFKTTQPLRKHWREVPEELADLLEQCLCEVPAERLQSFDQVLERLCALASPKVVRPPVPAEEPKVAVRPPVPLERAREWWRSVPGREGVKDGSGLVRRLRGHEGGVLSVAITTDARRLLSGGADGSVRLWDVEAEKELCCLRGHAGSVETVLFLGHSRFALSAGEDRTVRLWDLQSVEEVRYWPDRTNRSVAVSPDCRLALSGSTVDGMVRLWEVSTGRELRRFKGHMSWVHSVVFSADGHQALSASADGTVRLWDVDSGRELRRMQGHTELVWRAVFTAAGKHALSCGADCTVRLWDLRSGKEVCRFSKYTEPVLNAVCSPDGRFIVSGGDRGTVQPWEWKAERWHEWPPLAGHTDKVTSVIITADSRLVASASLDRTIALWMLPA